MTWSTSLSFLQGQDGIASGAEKLATSGPMGLAIVAVVAALVWTIKMLLKAKDDNNTDAKNNTTALLNVSDKTNNVANTINQTLVQHNERTERVEEALRANTEAFQENTVVLREVNEVLKTIRDQRMRR